MSHFDLKFWIGLAVAAVLGLLLTGRSVSAQEPTNNDGDRVLSGFLACGQAADKGRPCPSGIHYINLIGGRTYDMRLASTEFDAFLVLEDMQGQLLAADNDDFDVLNGQIVFRAPSNGSYRLVAAARPPMNEGFYTITIRAMPAVVSVEDTLSTSDEMRGDCYCKVYDVPMTAGRRYIIDLQSEEFAAFVKVLNMDGAIVAFAEEARPGGVRRVIYEAPRTEVLRILASSFEPRATGGFTLNVCEE